LRNSLTAAPPLAPVAPVMRQISSTMILVPSAVRRGTKLRHDRLNDADATFPKVALEIPGHLGELRSHHGMEAEWRR